MKKITSGQGTVHSSPHFFPEHGFEGHSLGSPQHWFSGTGAGEPSSHCALAQGKFKSQSSAAFVDSCCE